jgi:outer membrane murein-binding lipoprotein Lpp
VELLPVFVAGLIFLYSSITLLMTTTLLILSMLQARFRLTQVATEDQLLAVFAQTGLKRLGHRIVDPAASERATVSWSPHRFGRPRRQILHLYRNRLVRVQFFTGVAGLLAIAALGSAQDDLHITKFEIAIPAGPAFVAAAVLVLLFVTFGRMAVDAAGTALLRRISELPFMRAPTSTLPLPRESERVGTGSLFDSVASRVGAIAPILDSIERLIETIERGRNSVREPMLQLSASAEALAAMAKALSERPVDTVQAASYAASGGELKTAIDRLTVKIEQLAERPVDTAQAASYAATSDELRTAIERLTVKIEQLSERPAAAPVTSDEHVGEEIRTAIDRLATKIEQLAERSVEMQPAPVAAGAELKTAIDRLTAKIEQLDHNIFRSAAGGQAARELYELLKRLD